jgi:hypothetical protein
MTACSLVQRQRGPAIATAAAGPFQKTLDLRSTSSTTGQQSQTRWARAKAAALTERAAILGLVGRDRFPLASSSAGGRACDNSRPAYPVRSVRVGS